MSNPNCPKCENKMVLRNGKYGAFWGCSKFPKCKGIVKKVAENNTNGTLRKIENPSQYQKSIFDWVLNNQGNAVVSAAAGSGKTTTIEHVVAVLLENNPNQEVVYAVFNAHVQKSAQAKGLPALTTHSMGLKAISEYTRTRPKIEGAKVNNIVKHLVSEKWDLEKWMISPVANIVSKVKNTLAPTDDDTLSKICDRFGIEVNGSEERMFELVRLAMEENNRQLSVVDFDDMIYMPWKFKMAVKQYDWVLADECQDFNRAQIELVLKSVKPTGRVLAVGDKFQSMYGFRGAAIDAMDRIIAALEATELPLSITYRCSVEHVELVNQIFPDIPFEKWDNAKQGKTLSMSQDRMLGQAKDGDLVLCRTNAPLVEPVFSLIRRGVKAVIRGRDIGSNLINIIEKFNVDTVIELIPLLEDYRIKEVGKLLRAEKNSQAESLTDKIETIYALAEGCDYVSQIKLRIEEVFTDAKEGVIFSTVHRAKGDEADNVYILQPQLMPHKMAVKDWEVQQEKNILYVALSRAKETMIFVGGPAPAPIWDEEVTKEDIEEALEVLQIKEAEVHKDVVLAENGDYTVGQTFELKAGELKEIWNEPEITNCPF